MRGKVTFLTLGMMAMLGTGVAPRAQADEATASTVITPEVAQSFRENFNLALDNLQVVFERTKSAKGRELVADARQRMLAVTDQDIARTFARGGVPDLTRLVTAARKLAGPFDLPGASLIGDTSGMMTPNSPGLPGAPGIIGDCNNIAHNSSFTFGALIAWEIARAVIVAAQYACEEVVVILGEGGNGSAVCIPLAILSDAAQIPFELASFCSGEEDTALAQGSYARLEHIHGDVDAARVEVVNTDNSNTTQIMNNDNSNTTTILNNANASTTQIINTSNSNTTSILDSLGANADLAEAREIEDNLTRDACAAWMYTPEYADLAHTVRLGGRLEKVVSVIQGVINNASSLHTVRSRNLECAQDSLNHAMDKANRRPPLAAEKVCDLLLDAYEKVTPSLKDHDHGHWGDDRGHPGR